MKKRLLSIFLAACMLVVLMPAALAVQLETPTGLQWVTEAGTIPQSDTSGQTYNKDVFPLDIIWNRVPNASNEYRVVLYKDGVQVDASNWYFTATNNSAQLSIDIFSNEPRESGTYTFTIQAKGDGQNYEDSAVATSEPIVYTAPAAQLGQATGLRWEGETACWDAVAQALDYSIYWYYSATADGSFEEAGFTRGMNTTSLPLEDWVVLDHGEGYYKFAIRAMTSDVTQLRPGEISAQSDAYYTSEAASSVGGQLDDILTNLGDTPDEGQIDTALDAVQQLDTDALRVAMEADKTNTGITSKIEALEDKLGVSVAKEVTGFPTLNQQDITLTGAALNADSSKSVTFRVSKPAEDAVVPGVYANAVQFDFDLSGAAEKPSGELAVPIKIKMPVPENIIPEKLRILHYKQNGDLDEILLPALSEENGVWYATFVVKHFSTFAFAEVAPAAYIGSTYYNTLQDAIDAATSGASISLYRNHDDTETVLVEGKSLSISGGVYTISPDVVTVGVNCTKEVSGTNGVDQVIRVTYDPNGGSSGSGGSGGSSSSTNRPDVSTTGDGGRISASSDGTVTITPDKGYQIAKILVNGKEVAIPDNGKLTGLTKNDKVVVTFAKIVDPDGALPFMDVSEGAWYEEAVRYVYQNGMMSGTGSTAFSPNSTTTRAMIVAILHRMENEPSAAASDFTDVSSSSYYADAVAWSAANGIVYGTTDTTFAPDTAITREQLATILYRYAQFKGYDVTASTNLNVYADASQISSYAVTAMQWANAEGLILGNSSTTLNPLGQATRAEVAAILMRFCENIQ